MRPGRQLGSKRAGVPARLRSRPRRASPHRMAVPDSLRVKVMGIVLLALFLLAAGITAQGGLSVQEALRAELRDRAVAIAQDLAGRAAEPILTNNLYQLHATILEPTRHHSDVRYVVVLAPDGEILAHTFGADGVPRALVDAHQPSGVEPEARVLRTPEGLVWDVAAPILEGRAGIMRVGLTDQRVRETLGRLSVQMLSITGLVAVAGIAMAAYLAGILVKPVQELVDVAEQVGGGRLNARVTSPGSDEIGQLGRAFNRMAARLQRLVERLEENQRARRELLHRLMDAQEAERRRVARELHDELGQSLTSLTLGIGDLEERIGEPGSAARAVQLRELASEALERTRRIARQLRPSVLDDMGLQPALERLASDLAARHGVNVDVASVPPLPTRLPPEVETALYRIVQEALTNAIRHAGARTISVLLQAREGPGRGTVEAVVEDDGSGFDVEGALRRAAAGASMGLSGMKERADLLGGQVLWESGPGGTTVYVRLPLPGAGPPSHPGRVPEPARGGRPCTTHRPGL